MKGSLSIYLQRTPWSHSHEHAILPHVDGTKAARDHILLGHVTAVIVIQLDDTPEALDALQAELAALGLAPRGAKYERGGGVLTAELQLDRLPCPDGELGALLAPLMKQTYIRSVLW